MLTGGLQNKRGKCTHTRGTDLGSWIPFAGVQGTVLSFRGSFGLFSENALRPLSADLLTSFHFRARSQHSHTETCADLPAHNRAALSALWASPGCEQTTLRKDISHLPVPKPLSFIQSQHIVYASNFCRNNASSLAPPYQHFPKSSSGETVIRYHRNKSKFIFAAEKEIVQLKGLTDIKIIFV